MEARYARVILLLIPVVSGLLHWNFFKLDLMGIHVWRQAQTQTVINNFAWDDFNILHPKLNNNPDTDRIVRLEFPLMQWLFAIFYKLFGPHVIISRILSFVLGLFSVLGIYFLLKNIFGDRVIAALGAWAFNFSPVFFYYTINPMPDNFALCCAIWFAALFFKWSNKPNYFTLVASFFLLGLAALIKLPFILYIFLPCTYIIIRYHQDNSRSVNKYVFALLLLGISLMPFFAWYSYVIPRWGSYEVVKGITDSRMSLWQILYLLFGNLLSTLPELLINYGSLIFFIYAMYCIIKNGIYKNDYFMAFAIWGLAIICYFIYEINIIAFVHDYYLFPFLPLIFMLVAYGVREFLKIQIAYARYLAIALIAILPLLAYLRTVGRWDIIAPGFNTDFYTYKNELRKIAQPGDFCVVGKDKTPLVFLYYIDKKGWTFQNDSLKPELLREWVNKGARYFYTDCAVDTIPGIKAQLAEKVYDKASIRVYKLKEMN